MTFQADNDVSVWNGPDMAYKVRTRYQPDGTQVQLVGLDPANLDAFSRLRVSAPVTLFEAMFRHDLHPLWFEAKTATSGTVTHDPGQASAILTTTTASGSEAVLQTRQYMPYQPGKSQLAALTWHFPGTPANVRRRVGYFDASDGVYLEQLGSAVTINLRSSITGATLRSVAQADWNLDPMDGTGPSGHVLDMEVAQILLIDFQFLGVGLVRCAFDIDGAIVPFHVFQNANRLDTQPYMRTASLPLRYEITNTGATVAGATLQAICCQVMSEGGSDFAIGYNFAAASAADVATSTTRAHVMSIRPAAEFPAASGIAPRALIIPLDTSVQAASATILVEVFYNPTYSGGTWAAVDANSLVEVSRDATVSAPGTLIDGFYVAGATGASRSSGGNTINLQYPLTRDIANANPRALMVTATTVTGTGTARAVMSWREVR